MGKRAWQAQLPLGSNPYDAHDHAAERAQWIAGWYAARADSLQPEDE